MANKTNIKYSIIVPLYNKEKHIARTLDSILRQSIDDYEVIVIDDGSTDSSADKVRAFKSEKIILLSQNNSGVSKARNRGVASAKGEFVAFIDADDEWLPHHLASFEKMIEMYPDAGLYATAYRRMVEGQLLDEINEPKPDDRIHEIDYFKESFQRPLLPIHTSAVCIPREKLLATGCFNEQHSLGEDQDVWARIALKHPVVENGSVSSIYYIDSDNRSVGKCPDRDYPFIKYYYDHQDEIEKLGNEFVKEYVVRQELNIIRKWILHNQKDLARAKLDRISTRFQGKRVAVLKLLTYIPHALVEFSYRLLKSGGKR